MLQTIILGLAWIFTIYAFLNFMGITVIFINKLVNKRAFKFNYIGTMIIATVAIIFWCIFYYLTH